MFCKNCGNKLDVDAKFCPGCGTAVLSVEVENETMVDEKVEDNSALLDATENLKSDTVSSVENNPDEVDKDITQSTESPSEPEQTENVAVDCANESKQIEASKSENSTIEKIKEVLENIKEVLLPQKGKNGAVDCANESKQIEAAKSENSTIEKIKEVLKNIKEVLLPQKGKNGRVKFKDLSKKQKMIRIAIGAGLLLIALIFGAGKAGKSEVVAALYSKTAYPSGMEQAVSMGVYDNISLGDVLDYIFKNPNVSVSRDGDYYLVSISGKYRYSVGSDYVYDGTITYRVSESGSVSVASDPNNITGIIQSVAISMGYNY